MMGVIVVDKPRGISSHDAVQRMRRLADTRRVGHLGTLDPLGTGVLPLVIGKATRLSQFFLGHDRCYEVSVRCGFATDTYDSDGTASGETIPIELDRESVEHALAPFRGRFSQDPPPISAKKIGGTPAYKLTRRDEKVELEPVEVEIFELELLEVVSNQFRLRARCSAGTYMRSLAHDVGISLECGAHVTELRRTAMGEFDLAAARTFEDLSALADEGKLDQALVAAEALLPEFPSLRVDRDSVSRIRHGRLFRPAAGLDADPVPRVKAIGPDGRLLAIGEFEAPLGYHPFIVF